MVLGPGAGDLYRATGDERGVCDALADDERDAGPWLVSPCEFLVVKDVDGQEWSSAAGVLPVEREAVVGDVGLVKQPANESCGPEWVVLDDLGVDRDGVQVYVLAVADGDGLTAVG